MTTRSKKPANVLGKEFISGSDYSESKWKFKLKLQRKEQLNEEQQKPQVKNKARKKNADQEKNAEQKKRKNVHADIEKENQKAASSKKIRGNEPQKQLRAYMPIVPNMGDLKKSPYFSKLDKHQKTLLGTFYKHAMQ
ncbi:hypothetical protein MKX03_029681, partial [Papaver bracteatum]